MYSNETLIGYITANDGLTNCNVTKELNGISTLTFDLPLDSPKWSLLEDNIRIRVDGKEYCFMNPKEQKREDGLMGHVEMSETVALLGRRYPTVSEVPLAVQILSGEPGEGGFDAGSAGSALYRLLTAGGTTPPPPTFTRNSTAYNPDKLELGGYGWSVGTVDVDGFHDLETEKMSLLENIFEVQKIWGGWLVFDSINKTVSLRDDELWQRDTGFELRYAKNEKTLTKIEDWETVVTKLYPFGEKDLNIAAVNDGKIYLENYSFTSEIREGIWRREDIYDQQKLKEEAIKHLEKVCRPRVQYSADMLDLRTLSDYNHELFELGDIITIQDEELGKGVKVRLIYHSYDVLQPWNCSIKLGDPMKPFAELATAASVADWVQTNLRPSKSLNQLKVGLINTFYTLIESADGTIEWNDSSITFIETQNGVPTGKRVRLTSGGLGISKDGGQTYVTAITGEGILADKIIVNDLFALSSEDTYTKMNGSGIHVYDDTDTERLHLGHWIDGTHRFGLKVRNQKGDIVLDDQGILQTWQDHLVDNVDSTHPLTLNLYLPSATLSIVNARLRLKLEKFRAYEKSIASAPETTTPSGGGSTSGASSTSTTASGGGATSGASSTSTTASGGGGTSGSSSTKTTFAGGAHRHIMFDPTGYNAGTLTKREFYAKKYDQSNITVNIESASSATIYTYGQDQDHTHGMEHTHTISSHTHGMEHTHTVPAHTHGMQHTHTTPNHTHTIPSHTHNIDFGIYEDTTATGVRVTINGTDRTSALGGPFNSDRNDLNITPYLVAGQWNTIILSSTQLGRIDATVFLQAKMTT